MLDATASSPAQHSAAVGELRTPALHQLNPIRSSSQLIHTAAAPVQPLSMQQSKQSGLRHRQRIVAGDLSMPTGDNSRAASISSSQQNAGLDRRKASRGHTASTWHSALNASKTVAGSNGSGRKQQQAAAAPLARLKQRVTRSPSVTRPPSRGAPATESPLAAASSRQSGPAVQNVTFSSVRLRDSHAARAQSSSVPHQPRLQMSEEHRQLPSDGERPAQALPVSRSSECEPTLRGLEEVQRDAETTAVHRHSPHEQPSGTLGVKSWGPEATLASWHDNSLAEPSQPPNRCKPPL